MNILIEPGGLCVSVVGSGTFPILVYSKTELKDKALHILAGHQKELDDYLAKDSLFACSLIPHAPFPGAPFIINEISRYSELCGVGPMSGVTGALSCFMGVDLLPYSDEIIIDNGGSMYLNINKEKRMPVLASTPELSGKFTVKLKPRGGFGIASLSGVEMHHPGVDHAGNITVFADSPILAGCALDSFRKLVKTKDDMDAVIEYAKTIKGIFGIIVIVDGHCAAHGDIDFV